ncbi:hypothetical protein N7492_002575 [Penicillium capsulatum]|uniref:Uncharacterized protein n=1 Tax=Penicillium capsulatum TaxID=69766 RepID=A0A9W9LVT8_9EURO|nr:hypothetical protein N7492_002575 [Penicillium capsulatum]KAJ6122823.1 hypothetical protein N7512_005288 [Penicillium capsulatum]
MTTSLGDGIISTGNDHKGICVQAYVARSAIENPKRIASIEIEETKCRVPKTYRVVQARSNGSRIRGRSCGT